MTIDEKSQVEIPPVSYQVVNLSTSRYMTARYFSPFKTLSVYSASSVCTRENIVKTYSTWFAFRFSYSFQSGCSLLAPQRDGGKRIAPSEERNTEHCHKATTTSHLCLIPCVDISCVSFDVHMEEHGNETNFSPHPRGSYQFVE